MSWYEHAEVAGSIEELVAVALPRLKAELRAEAALLVIGSIGAPTTVSGDVEHLQPAFYFSEIVHADPMQRHGRLCRERVFTGYRAVPRTELLASRAYVDYYAPRHLGDVMATGLQGGDFLSSGMMSLVCFRSDKQRAFDRADVMRFEAGLTDFGAAVARTRPPLVDGASRELLLDAVATFLGDRSLLVFDELGRLAWLSPRARDQLGGRFQPPRDLVEAARHVAANPHVPSHVLPTILGAHRVVLRVVTRGQRAVVIAELVGAEQLSAAETRVFEAIGQGLSNADIARHLHLSVATVKTHVHRILGKLGVSSRVEAALLARGRA